MTKNSLCLIVENLEDIIKTYSCRKAIKAMGLDKIPTCVRCGFAEDRDLMNGKIPCGYRWCLAKEQFVRTMTLSCLVFFDLGVRMT